MKIRTIGIKMALALSAMLMAGCNDDLDGYGKSVGDLSSSEAIVFATSGGVGASAEPVTRHAGYVDEMVEEWELTGKQQSETRAAIRTSLYAQFNPAATQIYMYDDWNDNTKPYDMVPSEAQIGLGVMALPGRFDEQGIMTPLNPATMEDFTILWSETKQRYVAAGGSSSGNFAHFRAYSMAPLADIQKLGHDAGGDWSPTGGPHMRFNTGGRNGSTFKVPSIDYRVPEEPEDQLDIIAAATGEMDMGDVYGKRVPLSFFHTLAAVQFKVGFACRVVALTIDGVYKSGHCELKEDGEEEWTSLAGNYSHTFSFNDGTVTDYAEGDVLTDGDQTLMLIPQTIPDGATITLTYQPTGGGATQTIVCDISKFQWRAGHRYVYTLKEEPSYDIYFDIAAGNVTVNASTYTGYVYKNTYTTPERVTITGTHSASNRYYIYQSVPSGTTGYESTPGYNKGWTRDIDGTGKVPGAGSILELPKYDEVMSPDGSKTWSDYVTGNSAAHDITNNWETVAKQVKRARSNYKINIQGGIEAQVVLDNVWATNEDNFGASSAATSHRPYILNGTVYLKGVNHLTKVTPANNMELNFTSYYGDGSYKGFLQCTREKDTPFGMCGHTMLGYDGGSGTVTRINVLGGTLYVATTTENYSNDAVHTNNRSKNNGCISGPNNGAGYINISGGRVTAVSRSTSAAIGGGGGSQGYGGDGYVNISGNSIVYAYQRGEYCTNSNFTTGLRSTAIGGGSSFCSNSMRGEVTISDNAYVYAESIGGVAIGGGSSEGALGGNGVVTISGNPTVIAKSVSGYINGKSGNKIYVTAGTAIGGGAGGDWTGVAPYSSQSSLPNEQQTSANGGNAEVRIMGGKILTGSIGGGKEGVNYPNVKKGFAKVYISNGEVQAQALMAKGGTENCVFEMTNGKLSLSDDSFEFVEKNGGAVWMDEGDCTITGGTITNFKAQNGGAVYMEGGTFTMTGGSIQNCRAQYNSTTGLGGNGGAVYINDASGSATLNINGGTIFGNYADRNGGAIYLQGGNVSITDGYIQTCKALGLEVISTAADNKGNGGGIYLMKGNYTQTGGYVQGNFAKRNGGGIYVSSPSTSGNNIAVNIRDGEIRDNNCDRYGAGLYVMPQGANRANVYLGTSGQSNYESPRITGNSASLNGGGIYVARPVDHYDAGKPVYVTGSEANLYVYEGNIGGKIWKEMYKNNDNDNFVSAYVYNQDITNEGGLVTLALGGDGKPVADVDYITVTIDPNGGDFASGNTAADPIYRYLVTSSNSTLSLPTPKRKNFTFLGWQPSYGVVTTGYSDSQYVDGMIFNFYKDITLTAQWRSNF